MQQVYHFGPDHGVEQYLTEEDRAFDTWSNELRAGRGGDEGEDEE